MSYDWEKIQEIYTELSEYLSLDSPTSETEAFDAICELLVHPDYINGDLLEIALKEAKEKLKEYKDNYEVIETEKVFTHKVKSLEYRT